MSSPLSSLGKLRKVSLHLPELQGHGKRVVCFKENSYTDDEAALLSEILPPLHWAHNSTSSNPSSSARSKANDSTPGDNELMSIMTKRLTKMEQRVRSQAQEISRKNQQIAMLEEKLSVLQQANKIADEPKRQQELDGYLQLQNQVWEMEKFLNDYGMIWVGTKKDETSNVYLKEEEEPREYSDASGPVLYPGDAATDSFQIEFDLVLQNIKDLNILAGEGEAAVEHVTGGARLKRPDPIPLTLFKNGIVLFNGPFRSFSQPSTQQCMQDIMDGYFPSELQSRYPNGIPFKVTDRRDVIYRDRRGYVEFPGVGQKVDAHHDHKGSRKQDFEFVKETSEVSGKKLSVEQFLNKLPKTVIRAGKAFDIRGEIKVLLQTPCLQALKERLEVREGTPPTLRNVSTLRIKSENGEKMYIIKMFFSETVGDLRAHLDQGRGEQQLDYDIISTFPQRVYSDQSKTLMEYGLVPSATLILRPQRSQILTQQHEMVTPSLRTHALTPQLLSHPRITLRPISNNRKLEGHSLPTPHLGRKHADFRSFVPDRTLERQQNNY
ncbi:UBX domain-containing protein 11 [Pristis pectinata]|uniref:UBX domain-containing protein 11 n=1 Tax=Pristis pectinata TaxID=685728 RepID=UPI00223DE717|nr:UBX domain-containing protein 11 [Pristis pectinata]